MSPIICFRGLAGTTVRRGAFDGGSSDEISPGAGDAERPSGYVVYEADAQPVQLVAEIYDRMPLMLAPADYLRFRWQGNGMGWG